MIDGDSAQGKRGLADYYSQHITFNEIFDLGLKSCGSDVEYLLLIINHAGRKFITGVGEEGDGDGGTTTMAIGNDNGDWQQQQQQQQQ